MPPYTKKELENVCEDAAAKYNYAVSEELRASVETGMLNARCGTEEPRHTASDAFRLALAEYQSLTEQVDMLEGMADFAWQASNRKVELRCTVGPPCVGDHWVGVRFKGYDLAEAMYRQVERLQKRRRYLRPLLLEANALAASMFPGKPVTLVLPRTMKEKKRSKGRAKP